MILYNVTLILENEIQNDCLCWLQKMQIPKAMDTGYFISNRLLKVLDSPNEGLTYCIQFVSESVQKLNEFKQKHGGILESDIPQEFNNKLVIFPSIMEFIDNQ
jgi:hypothetical protein